MGVQWFDSDSCNWENNDQSESLDTPIKDNRQLLDEFINERAMARNTFLCRLECDPKPSPYDFGLDVGSDLKREVGPNNKRWSFLNREQLQTPNFYDGRPDPFAGALQIDVLPIARDS